jgi:Putative transposase
MIVPGGVSLDGTRWVPCRPDFLVHVKVLAPLFRGKFLAMLIDAQCRHLKTCTAPRHATAMQSF